MNIIIAGCGRMGQGIAITCTLAGYQIQLIDMKEINWKNFNLLLDQTITKLNSTLNILYNIKLIKKVHIKKIIKNISIIHYSTLHKNLNFAAISMKRYILIKNKTKTIGPPWSIKLLHIFKKSNITF